MLQRRQELWWPCEEKEEVIQYKNDICTECDAEDVPIVKKILPHKYCHTCNQARLEERKPKKEVNWASKKKQKPLKRSPIRYKPKTTGEGVFLESIWNTRPHVSWISGKSLGDEYNVMCLFHILGKGAFPGFRLYDKNLILTTPQEHHDWHNMTRDKLLEKDPRWQNVFDLYEELQQEYYA